MESREEHLLKAIFRNVEDELNEVEGVGEAEDNYPETLSEKVGYSEFVIMKVLENLPRALQRLSRLQRLLMLEEKSAENKLPEVITKNELLSAETILKSVKFDIAEITEMLSEVYEGLGGDELKGEV